jgi:hypothetical protein
MQWVVVELQISRQASFRQNVPHFNAEGAEVTRRSQRIWRSVLLLSLLKLSNRVSGCHTWHLKDDSLRCLKNSGISDVNPTTPKSLRPPRNLRDLRVRNCGVVNGSNP